MQAVIEMTDERVWDDYKGKEVGSYVAQIVGPGTRWPLERKFLRVKPSAGSATLPHRDGVYEVRDFVAGSKRVRYFQVHDGAMRLIEAPSDDDVLDAVDSAASGEWWEGAEDAPDGVASTMDVLEALDRCVAAVESNDVLDKEDVLMELDKVRRVVERL